MSRNYDKVTNLLPNLQIDEIKQVRDRCEALLALRGESVGGASGVVDVNSHEYMIYEAMVRKLKDLGHHQVRPYQVFAGTNEYKHFKKNVDIFNTYFEQTLSKFKRVQKQRFFRLCVDLLAEDLAYHKLALTEGVLARNIGRLPDVVERAFPGYAQAGMLSVVITKNIEGR